MLKLFLFLLLCCAALTLMYVAARAHSRERTAPQPRHAAPAEEYPTRVFPAIRQEHPTHTLRADDGDVVLSRRRRDDDDWPEQESWRPGELAALAGPKMPAAEPASDWFAKFTERHNEIMDAESRRHQLAMQALSVRDGAQSVVGADKVDGRVNTSMPSAAPVNADSALPSGLDGEEPYQLPDLSDIQLWRS